ncbi:MAG: lamin tail domain-containing protein, partial [Bacteroidales bacterium]|nr:lamin tail domain-containing protein [Bacteroidales bacterium]
VWSDDSLLTAPAPCVSCIDSAWVQDIGTCDQETNTYTYTLNWKLSYPVSGLWVIQIGNDRDTVPFMPQKGANQGYAFMIGIADGLPVDVTIYNVNDPGCSATFNDLWTAPQYCFDQPELVINEVDYDQPGAGDPSEFIEIKNKDNNGLDLEGYSLKLINGNGGLPYATFTFTEGMFIPAGGYFVICANAANTENCDWDVSPNNDLIQNGPTSSGPYPDAMALYDPYGVVLDMLSYEGDVPGYTEGSGVGLNDNGNTPGHGLSRYPDGVDTDVNNVDFIFKCITPGEPNTNLSGYCGPFHTGTFKVYYGNPVTPTDLPMVTVTVSKGSVVVDQQVTDGAGEVVFDSLQNASYTFTIDPSIYPWGWGGVNALDAMLIAKSTVGLWPLNGIFAMAADVNGASGINSTDAQLVARRFAGLDPSFSVGDWVPLSWQFNLSWPEDSAFNEYFAILSYGDVNGSHKPFVPITKAEGINLVSKGELMATSALISLPVSLSIPSQPGALSLVMSLPGNIRLVDIHMLDGSQPMYTLEGNVLTLSWFSLQTMNLPAGMPLFTLEAMVEGTLDASSFDLLPGTEFAEVNGEKIEGFSLFIPSVEDARASLSLYPNPATDKVRLTYTVPVEGDLQISIYNMLGAQVGVLHSAYHEAGNHEFTFSLDGLLEGTYFLQMESGAYRAMDRLVIVK